MEFAGPAKKITAGDFDRAAQPLACEVAAIRAVAEVESGGRSGFLADGRPKIQFESRKFHIHSAGRFDQSHPDISTPTWVRSYAGGAGEYDRLAKALELDREVALKSASWSMFQILGSNHAVAGFDSVEAFVTAQLESEGAHLDAFVNFVIKNRLDDELRDKRWADFARGYNGPAFAENRYDEKMANAYAKHAGGVIVPSTLDIQQALNRHGATLVADGISGPATKAALRTFQNDAGLAITGTADEATQAALGLSPSHDPVALSASMNGK